MALRQQLRADQDVALPAPDACEGTSEHRRIAAPIDEHQALFAPRKTLTDRIQYWRAESLFGRLGAHIDGAHDRQPRAGRSAFCELDALIAALPEVVPTLERGRRAAEH